METRVLATSLSIIVCLSACASSEGRPMNTGERISQRGGDIGQYGQAWSDGQSDVTRGQRSVEASGRQLADGEKNLARAREQVARAEEQIRTARATRVTGEQLIQDGTGQMRSAEAAYSAIRAGPSALPL